MRILLLFFALLCTSIASAQHFSEWTSVPPENQDDFLDIPSTHVWQQVVRRGMTMTDGSSVGPNLDFTSFISANGSSTTGYLGVNSEGGPQIFGIGDPGQVVFFDLSFNPTSNLWETTSSQQVDFSYYGCSGVGSSGTLRNCSGGVSPWGTYITSEEYTEATCTKDGYQTFGWNIEIDPVTKTIIDYNNDGTPDKIWSMGRCKHENICFTQDSLVAYTGADEGDGYLFKLVMASKGNLGAGNLYVLRDLGSGNYDWLQVPNSTPAECNNTMGFAGNNGAADFNRVEDVEIHPITGQVYFTSTTNGKVYRFDDLGLSIANFETYVGNSSYTINHGSGQTSLSFGQPDNLCFDNLGNLYITQDGGEGNVWVARAGHNDLTNPSIDVFANTPNSCEPTGISFTPDYRFMFMSIQHPSFANSGSVVDAAGVNIAFNEDVVVVIARREVLGPTACDSMALAYLTSVATCGSADGSISITGVSGGSAPYSYAWSNGSTGQVLNNVASGFYMVVVTDANGCTDSTSIFLDCQGGSSCTSFVYDLDSTIGYCGTASNSLSVTNVSGGSPPYTYTLNNGAPSTSGYFGQLDAGNYELIIFDYSGCRDTLNVQLSCEEIICNAMSISYALDTPQCGETNGFIAINGSNGGIGPYQYDWLVDGNSISDANGIIVGEGLLEIFVTDALGCRDSMTVLIPCNDDGSADVLDTITIDAGSILTSPDDIVAINNGQTTISLGPGEVVIIENQSNFMSYINSTGGVLVIGLNDGLIVNQNNEIVGFIDFDATSIGEVSQAENLVSVYPVPTNDVLHIYFNRSVGSVSGEEIEAFEVYDVSGKQHKVKLKVLGQTQATISVGDLHDGTYLLYVKAIDEVIVKRFIVAR